jgi:hypothetical protein
VGASRRGSASTRCCRRSRFSAALAVLLWQWRAVVAVSPRAVTNAFAEIGRYKQALHRAIWGSALTLALALALLRGLGVGS